MAGANSYDYIVVDAQNLAHRYWWVHRDRLTSRGLKSGLEFGFITRILDLVREYAPGRVVVVWDGTSKRLNQIDPTYKVKEKALTEVEPKLLGHFQILMDAFSPHLLTLWDPEAEADETIARFLESLSGDKSALVVSGDRDFHQLVSPRITILDRQRAYRDEKYVRDTWGVEPFQVPLFRAIEGDKSDNLDGVGKIRKETIKGLVDGCLGVEGLILNIKYSDWLTKKEKEKLIHGESLIRKNVSLMDLSGLGTDWTPYQGEVCKDLILGVCKDFEIREALVSKSWNLMKHWW